MKYIETEVSTMFTAVHHNFHPFVFPEKPEETIFTVAAFFNRIHVNKSAVTAMLK